MRTFGLKTLTSYLLCMLWLYSTPVYAQTAMDFKVNLIKKIANEVTFPSTVTKDEFVIGVVANKSTFEAFTASLGAYKVKGGKRVSVKQITTVNDIGLYPIIYFTEDKPLTIGRVITTIGSKPSLLITEKAGYVEIGSDVNLVQQGSIWRYEINTFTIGKKRLFASDDLQTKALLTVGLPPEGKPNDGTTTTDPILIKYRPNPEDARTIARQNEQIKNLQEELEKEIKARKRRENDAERKNEELLKGSQDLKQLRTKLDTMTSVVALKNIAIEQSEKAQIATINQLTAENEVKEKDRKAKADKEIANQRLFVIALIGILAVISTITILTVIASQRRKKIIKQLELAKNSLAASNQEIQIQKNELEEKKDKITDSIRYAMTIQEAMLPNESELKEIFASHFVMYAPKDIVSGDFYWVTKRKEGIFAAVADCTGHGVPGAFLSTVGNDILNELIKEKNVFEPNEILSRLHVSIYERLKQGTSQNKDGMDICLCRIIEQEDGTCTVVFAGAKRPIYYSENGNIKSVKGDSKYIGGIQENAPTFNNHVISLQKGEKIYLTTDGYADTPNHEKRKFGSGKFQELMQELHNQDLKKQHKIFIERWEAHRNNAEIRDDTTILAFEI